MEWLNYHHLLYFHSVAKFGSISAASRELRLAPPTISAQLRSLEESLGEKLFTKSGRRLVLTETGQVVLQYADEIFSLGREMVDAVKDRPTGRPVRLIVGIADVLPKWIAYKLIQPALQLPERVQLKCREARPERLLADLAIHELDVILSDAPAPPLSRVKAFNHLLGDCGVVFLAAPKQAQRLRGRFPHSLDGAPMLLPSDNTAFRGSLDHWFDDHGIRPAAVGEFDDFALLHTFAEAGQGIFAAADVLETQLRTVYGFRRVGHTDDVRAHFYAISVERHLQHPGVVAICETGRNALFRNA
jgi:LysR family transcriptional regulator, transcriptional activator of nhaA